MDQLGNQSQSHIQSYADNNLNEKNIDQSLVYDGSQVFQNQQHNLDINNTNVYTYESTASESVVRMQSSDVYVTESQGSGHTVENHYQDNALISTGVDAVSNAYHETIVETHETVPITVQATIQNVETNMKDPVCASKENQGSYILQEAENVFIPQCSEASQSSQSETEQQASHSAETAQPDSSEHQEVQGEVIQTGVTELPPENPESAAYEESATEGTYIVNEPDAETTTHETKAEKSPSDEDNVEVITLTEDLGEVDGQVQDVQIEEIVEDNTEVKESDLKGKVNDEEEAMDTHENISEDCDMNNELNEQTGEMEMRKVPREVEETDPNAAGRLEVSEQEQAAGDRMAIDDVPPEGNFPISENAEEVTNQEGEEILTINEDYAESEIVDNPPHQGELKMESKSTTLSPTSSGTGKKRGRKSTNDIPLHVLGHNLDKPVDTLLNGRTTKPRLGVKVPPRNLTSQIVSKDDIQKELIERSKKKEAQAGGKVFANKLTRRLAKKIAPAVNLTIEDDSEESEPIKTTELNDDPLADTSGSVPTSTINATNTNDKQIQDNSDLLAILEGEGEDMPVLPKEIQETVPDDSNIKNLEREIALQQLSDLPYLSPKQRTYRGRMCKEAKPPTLDAESAVKSTASTSRGTNTPSLSLSNKENSTTVVAPLSPKKDEKSPKKGPIEVEPQIKVNMALKTYSRKRKASDNVELYPEAKRSVTEFVTEVKSKNENPTIPTDVYVTKSSRVIKRKVIWDPDETPSRSSKQNIKTEPTQTTQGSTPKATPVKAARSEKPEKAPEIKVATEKKSETIDTEKKNETPKVKSENKEEKTKVIAKKVETPHKKNVGATPKKINESPVKRSSESHPGKLEASQKKSETTDKQPETSQSDRKSVVSPGSKLGMKYKKSRSEVDKLLGDEGAIKMLYELKNTEETETRRKKNVISVDKTYKELAKKATEIKSVLANSNESPKALRKKDSPSPSGAPLKPPTSVTAAAISRQKSKDSTRSTPPSSPAYSFSNTETTYLIRRRSSSSFSSGGEDRDDSIERTSRSKAKRLKRSAAQSQKEIRKDPLAIESDKEKSDPLESELEKVEKKQSKVDGKYGTYEAFTVKKAGKHVTIDMNYGGGESYLTFKTLVDLSNAMSKIALDKDCNVVLLTSSTKAFCLGLDYRFLVSDRESERKKKATELAWEVSNFLKCLLYFPKVIVAGIQGECVGLGVTMLPLFDIIVASDQSSFTTSYSTLGCVAEGGFLLTMPFLTNHGLAAELLYTSQTLSADDVFRRGLISKLCWPEKYQDSLKNLVVTIARGSRQSLESTKKLLNSSLLSTTSAAIESMEKTLIEHWTSNECQKNFIKLDSGDF